MENPLKPKYISDEQLLRWIEDGSLVIRCLNRRDPTLIFRGREIKPYLDSHEENGDNPRYRWKIHDRYKRLRSGRVIRIRRSIARSKLVWMYANRRVVREGHLIHHEDEDRFNDRAKNLVEVSEEHHNNHHYGNGDDVPF